MKKLLLALFILLTACNPAEPTLGTEVSASPTDFVLPQVTQTAAPSATPVVVTPTPTAVPTIETETYVIQPGDTLTSIAEKFGMTPEDLAGINNIPDWNVIYAGQTIVLKGTVEIPQPTITDGKQIIVKLSIQRIFVYENGQLLKTFLVSTGITYYPTRVGEFRIWEKLPETRMTGPGYDLPHVKWTMYFDESRGFHAKYWNDIYGRPSSHGCVNMTEEDAKWLYDWAPMGTDVLVIP